MENVALSKDKETREILAEYRSLLEVCRPTTSPTDRKRIKEAFKFALNAHKEHRRKSGDPYIYHPIAVAKIAVQEIGLGTTSVICSLLHDVVEDTHHSTNDIRDYFDEEVARIVDGLTKISGIFDQTKSVQAENFRKMLLTLSDDVRVILIKLADRLHNMRTLDAMPPKKQLKIANETIYLFAPLAHRLGFHAIKSELEDLSLKYTDPDIYNDISRRLEQSAEERNQFIDNFVNPIKQVLSEQGMNYRIMSRTKSISSIYGKMTKQQIDFDAVYDIFAIRIVLDTPESREKADCWRVYSFITDIYRPNPDRLRDWISIPKANGYESLHTTVMSSTGKWVEVQIRSKRMDEIAEKGYAAHWKYKETKTDSEGSIDKWLIRIRDLLKSSERDAMDFIDDFKLNLFSDEIFVFTPKGELRTLPVGSTALDFAYSIHTKIGDQCLGAKISHKLVPLSHPLKSGDQIEIITSSKQKPKSDWVNYVVTARAKAKIKAALKEERKKIAADGKEKLDRKLKQLKIDNSHESIQQLLKHFKLQSPIDLYYDFAIDKLGIKDLKNYLNEKEKGGILSYLKNPFGRSQKSAATDVEELDPLRQKLKEKPDTLLIGDSQEALDYTLSPCCNPIPGDDVFGHATRREGIKIHRTNCPNAEGIFSKEATQILKAKWYTGKSIAFLSGISISGIDDRGILNDLTNLISSEYNLNIRSINIDSTAGTFTGTVMLYVNDTQHLNNLIKKIRKINGVRQVTRIQKS